MAVRRGQAARPIPALGKSFAVIPTDPCAVQAVSRGAPVPGMARKSSSWPVRALPTFKDSSGAEFFWVQGERPSLEWQLRSCVRSQRPGLLSVSKGAQADWRL